MSFIDQESLDIREEIVKKLSALYNETPQISRFEVTDIKPFEYPYFRKSNRSTAYIINRRNDSAMDVMTEGENFLCGLIPLKKFNQKYIDTVRGALKNINSTVYMSVCFLRADSIDIGMFGIFLVTPVVLV